MDPLININTLLTNMEQDINQHLYSTIDDEEAEIDKNILPLLSYDSHKKLKTIRKKANKYRNNIIFKRKTSVSENCSKNISDSMYDGFLSESDKSPECHSDCDNYSRKLDTSNELLKNLSEISYNDKITKSKLKKLSKVKHDNLESNNDNSINSIGEMNITNTDEKDITNTERKKISSMFENINNK